MIRTFIEVPVGLERYVFLWGATVRENVAEQEFFMLILN